MVRMTIEKQGGKCKSCARDTIKKKVKQFVKKGLVRSLIKHVIPMSPIPLTPPTMYSDYDVFKFFKTDKQTEKYTEIFKYNTKPIM